jgi:hypothetical protein
MALSQMHQQQVIKATARQSAHPAILQVPRLTHSSSRHISRSQRSRAHICCAVQSEQQEVQQKVQPESAVPGMSAYLDSLKWSKDGLVPVIVQVRAAAAVSITST